MIVIVSSMNQSRGTLHVWKQLDYPAETAMNGHGKTVDKAASSKIKLSLYSREKAHFAKWTN